jgi:uncharacterized C2H2 Zn-finger protein
VSAKNLHLLVDQLVRGIASDPRWPAALESAYAPECPGSQVSKVDVEQVREELTTEMASLRAERKKAVSNARRALIDAEIDDIDQRVTALERSGPAPTMRTAPRLPLAERWSMMSKEQRRSLLTELLDRIDILPFDAQAVRRGRTFAPSRVRIEIRNVGTFQLPPSFEVVPSVVACPECQEQVVEGAALGAHRRLKHGVVGARAGQRREPVLLECPEEACDLTSRSPGGMRRHMQMKHGQTDAFPCPTCSKVLRSAIDLASHVRMAHDSTADRDLTPCRECGKVLRGTHGLLIHMGRVHRRAN